MKIAENRIRRLLAAGPVDFNILLCNTWGIYPSELLDILEHMEKEGKVRRNGDRWSLQKSDHVEHTVALHAFPSGKALQSVVKKVTGFIESLPAPHPHDFDWRFSINGIESFARHVVSLHGPREPIMVVAAPTLYVFLRTTGYFEKLSLVERSEATVEAIRKLFGEAAGVHTHDLQYPWTPHLQGEFSCICMDPPWYQDYYELFLSRSMEQLLPGGFIHTALFPPFTRDTALRERAAIFSFAQHSGLSLIELQRGALEYSAPHFEMRSLVADGQAQPQHWRRGDLATFFFGEKLGHQTIANVEAGRWLEHRIDKSKLKIRVDGARTYEKPIIGQVEKGSDTIPTVSRRYAKREQICLWTSYQQAYSVEGAHVVDMLLVAILNGQDIDVAAKEIAREFQLDITVVKNDIQLAFETLKQIIARERAYAKEYKATTN